MSRALDMWLGCHRCNCEIDCETMCPCRCVRLLSCGNRLWDDVSMSLCRLLSCGDRLVMERRIVVTHLDLISLTTWIRSRCLATWKPWTTSTSSRSELVTMTACLFTWLSLILHYQSIKQCFIRWPKYWNTAMSTGDSQLMSSVWLHEQVCVETTNYGQWFC